VLRYIALSWDADNLSAVHAAGRWNLKLQSADFGWHRALSRSTLSVFASGLQPRVNSAYALPAEQGVVLGKLFRRADLESAAGADIPLNDHEAAQIVQSRGRVLIDHYWGRYIAVLHDAASGGMRVLRDPSGALPCYLIEHRGVRIVFSWFEDILALDPTLPPPMVNWDYMAVQIVARVLECRDTAIQGVSRILPGEAVLLAKGGMSSETWWDATHFARATFDPGREAAAAALRSTVRGCVRSWGGCHDDVLLRLSGGLDSSIVLICLAAGDTPTRVTGVTDYSEGSDSDERDYARLAARHAQRELVERQRDPSFRLERILEVARTPTPSLYLGYLDADRLDVELGAKRGATAVFTGGGGDQLFYVFRSHHPAADYLRHRGLDSGFISAALDAARLGKVSVWTALRFALLDRLRRRAPDALADADEYTSLAASAAVRAAQNDRRFLHPALHDLRALPIGKLEQIKRLVYPADYYDPLNRDSTLDRIHALMSQPIVELCLRLPSYLLVNGGRDRALARQAFAADLPAQIVQRRSKGGLEEYAKAALMQNLDFVRGMLLDGALVRAGLLDRHKLEEVLSGRPTTIAAQMGELHEYLGVEAWLSRWSAGRQRAAA
jgi:asparagine synthase (glutamine-hydrolysing)